MLPLPQTFLRAWQKYMPSLKKKLSHQTTWTTGFKFKLVIAKTSLYTKFELFSPMCPHIGGLNFLHRFFPFFASFWTQVLTLYKSMGKIFKFKILYFLLQNWNLHWILDWKTYNFLYFGKLFTLLATKCKSKLEQCLIYIRLLSLRHYCKRK